MGKVSYLYIFQASDGSHPASNPVGTGGSFPGGKADYSPEINPMSRIYRSIHPLSIMSSWHSACQLSTWATKSFSYLLYLN
jgi:hypothetical protein